MKGTNDRSEKDGAQAERCPQPVCETERRVLERLVFFGESEAMQRLRRQVQVMAPHLRGAIVEAEPGLGGEVLAGELHRLSGAGSEPLWSMDVAAEDALERCKQAQLQASVLLRGLPGAKPAVQRRLLELMRASRAGRGPTRWMVLTEVSPKLLGTQAQLLPELVRALPAVTIRLTPLRERREDVGKLAAKAMELLCGENAPVLDRETTEILKAHRWAANLEELIRSLHAWVSEGSNSPQELAATLLRPRRVEPYLTAVDLPEEEPVLLQKVIDRHLLRVLRRCSGNKLRAAEMLGVSRSTLYRMLEAISGSDQRAEAV